MHPQCEHLKCLSTSNGDVIAKSMQKIFIVSAVGPNLLAGEVKSTFAPKIEKDSS